MRLQSKKPATIGHTTIGGTNVKICIPLTAEKGPELLNQAREMVDAGPDILEWRIDGFDGVESISDSLETLKAVRRQIDPIPLILTCRIDSEGGFKPVAQEHRLSLILAAIQSGHVEMVDVEMCNEPHYIESVKAASKASGTKLILSFHDFEGTPEESFIHDKLARAQDLGADIAKVAVMPHGYDDVLTLLNATLRARNLIVQIPMVTMAMGDVGRVTRIAGGLFGSDMTFAMGREVSAPGQIPIHRLRKAMDVIYNS